MKRRGEVFLELTEEVGDVYDFRATTPSPRLCFTLRAFGSTASLVNLATAPSCTVD